MLPHDLARLKQKLDEAIFGRPPGATVAIVGWTAAAFELAVAPAFAAGAAHLLGIFAPDGKGFIQPLDALVVSPPDILVIAEDWDKEALLEAVAVIVPPTTRILVGGYAHFEFRDPLFESAQRDLLVPSFANGYPHCLVHIYQCLVNAHRLGLDGVVAEFGMFKGGTTMLISRFIQEIGATWKVYGFDTFDGFPARRSPLDMYDHPDCVILDSQHVRAMFVGRNVEIVAGDVVQTVGRLVDQQLVLSFVDTDNYTSARAIINVIADRIQVGGAIVFDHWAGHGRFIDTIGERIAAKALAADPRYFNLHGTGVFVRQR
jgi:O-methyltransferase